MSLTTVTDFVVDLHLGNVYLFDCVDSFNQSAALSLMGFFCTRFVVSHLLGRYKYLLAAFASFDVFLSIAHALTRLTVVILDTIFGVVTDAVLIQDRRLTGAYCACFTVPFILMNIHFLYRFWSIRHPHLIHLFSNKKFIAFIVAIPIFDFIIW
uniref:G protein-coupled receptor n=1 Tax=Pristionchus pacificus TaxID=54126 RepID=A0A8R1YY55_PRIPA